MVAYEPVWAIGTGLTPTPRMWPKCMASSASGSTHVTGGGGSGIRILYGGSVKPGECQRTPGGHDVNGALVGGASLKAADFLGIAAVYR